MPTPFPYSKVSATPVLISELLLPVLNNIILELANTSVLINIIIENIPTNVNCNDADIRALRNQLAALIKILDTINSVLPVINTVISILRLLTKVGSATATAATLIPPPLVAGAVVTAGQAAGELAANASTVVSSISFIINRLVGIFPAVLSSVRLADKFLNDLCNESNTNAENFINNLTDSTSIVVTNSPFATAQDLLDQYPSTFYTELNVSDDDLNTRFQTIVKLIDDGFDVINNLVELPTKVLRGQGAPANTVGTAGEFYINTQTSELFGPKPTNESWT